METHDLADKKSDNEQQLNEGFSGENLPENYNPSAAPLETESETDREGNTDIVQRQRNPDGKPSTRSDTSSPTTKDNMQNTVENKDRNSDIEVNRYPNSHPDNHQNRGNIEL